MLAFMPAIAAALCVMLCSCAPDCPLRIESSDQAVVRDWGGRIVCASTPCTMRVSRETCRFYDSSSGHIILEAVSRAGVRLRSMPIVTCDVSPGMRLSFVFQSGTPDCGAVLFDGNSVVSVISCRDSMVKLPR